MRTVVPATNRHMCSASLLKGLLPAGADASITISTIDEDREGDVLVPEGAKLGPYKKNPVVMQGHDHHGIPVGRTVHLTVEPGKGIRADFAWLRNDPFADRVRNAFEQGVLNGASVGFRPLAYEPNGSRGWRYTEWELLEWSLVPVPANANAVKILKRFGLDMPTPAAQLNATLDLVTSALKAGRVLSAANEDRLRRATGLLSDVLDQLEDNADAADDGEQDEKDIAVIVDGGTPMLISDDSLREAITAFVNEEVEKATGRIPDPPLPYDKHQPVVYMSEDDLNVLVRDIFEQALREGLNAATGRVD